MSALLTPSNLLFYSVQILALVAAGVLLAIPLAKADARLRLLHWQVLLVLCLLLPVCGRWRPADPGDITVTTGVAQAVASPAAPAPMHIPWDRMALAVILTGSLLFAGRIILGAWRIHLYRRHSTPLSIPSVEAEFHVSPEISGPVTFGFLRPVVLLPKYFADLPPDAQAAVCEHELAHVRRRDWIFSLMEELLRAVLWFHPAIWYVLGRIHLAREQAVDQEVLRATRNRDAYLDALLSVAGLKSHFAFLPAPLFLKKRHLAARVANILNEVSHMDRKKMLLSLGLNSAALLLTATLATALLPLEAPAQSSNEGATGASRSGPSVLHRVRAEYPPDAKLKRIEGKVTLDVSVDTKGMVSEARVISGPEELRRAAVQAVLQWQFAAGSAPTHAEVEMNFSLSSKTAPRMIGILRKVEYLGIDPALQARIAPRIPVKEGETLTNDAAIEIQRAVTEVDGRLRASLTEDNVLRVSLMSTTLRIGGNVQSAKLKKKVAPVYPPAAKAERIQGTVRLQARIAKDGTIADLQLLNGDPILAEAAMPAVRQWEYEKTLLNGEPVEVITQIDINFTLSQ